MRYNAELCFTEKLLHSYYLSFHQYQEPLDPNICPDKGLRKMLNPDINYSESIRAIPQQLRQNTIYRIEDAFHCIYLSFLLPETEASAVICVGPYCVQEMTKDDLLTITHALSLPPSKAEQLRKYYESIPLIVEEGNLLNIILVLGSYLWGSLDAFSMKNIHVPLFNELFSLKYNGDSDAEEAHLSMRLLEDRYAIESRLIQAVSQGQTSKAEMLLGSFQNLQLEQRTGDALRNRKNYSIVLNTLLRKAAETGDVHPIHIDRLSSHFARGIESAVSPRALVALNKEMVRKYCLLVKNHSMKGYSLLVRKVLTRIDTDLTADLSLRTQADLLNVNSSYLSTLFKKETGMTLTEYVNKKRIKNAILLLNTTNLQIQTIAQYCGIPDVNYFTKTFKKYIGKTPKEYRDLIVPYRETSFDAK